MMTPRFEAVSVTKTFGSSRALDAVSFVIDGPGVVGLLGRNGAGKTTLLQLVSGLRLPSAGVARTFGTNTHTLGHVELARLGVVSQSPTFPEWMTVAQFLGYLSPFYPNWDTSRQRTWVDALELDTSSAVSSLSGGDRQKHAVVARGMNLNDLFPVLVVEEAVCA